jgi:putative transposase/transposase-like zinc-binding protein
MAPALATYAPRDPSHTVLYTVIADHLETFLASLDTDPDATGLPAYVEREFYAYLQCGILAHGFLRLGCDTCPKELLLPFSCKRRGFCPSCAARRMAQTAAHLVECVIPWVPTRQWVVSVPVPLRYWMASSQDLTAQVHTIIRTTIGQYYVNQAVTRGFERANLQPGSVTFIQRFGSALNLHLHFHILFLEGVYLDRTEASLKPRFLTVEPPSDADVANVMQKISHRVIRKLRHLGYLEAGGDAAVATGYDPLVEDAPALARTLAASVQQRMAFGERAGQHVRRIGSGFGHEGEHPALTGPRCARVHGFSLHANTEIPAHRRDQLERLIRYTGRGAVSLERLQEDANGDLVYTFTHPWSDGTTGITLSPLELLEKLAALVPLPRVHLVRYGGCLAPHSHLRGAIRPTPRQQGLDGEEAHTGTPYWPWARLLGRVFGLEMSTCPFCRRGTLRLIAVIAQESVITRILRHLQLASVPPPIAPARARQERFTFA